MRRWSAAALAIAIACASMQAQSSSPLLQIDAPPALAAAAARLDRLDRARVDDFARTLGLEDAGAPIRVILAASESPLDRRTPAWIAGFADGASETIVLFPERSPSYPHDSLEAVLHHEIAHILIARAARGGTVPRWLHEGLAMSAEPRSRFADRAHLVLAWIASPGPLAALDAEFEAGDSRAARAYAVSYAFVQELVAEHGPDLPRRLLSRLAAGDTIDQALVATTSLPLAAAEREFQQRRWWSHVVPFATSSLALWMGITLLALYAIRRRAVRRAELRRRWADEEAHEEGHEGRDALSHSTHSTQGQPSLH